MGNIQPYLWSKRREAKLIRLWNKKMGARALAEALGGFEHCKNPRNAILGKVYRLRQAGLLPKPPPQPPRKARNKSKGSESRALPTEQKVPVNKGAVFAFPAPSAELPADVIKALQNALYHD